MKKVMMIVMMMVMLMGIPVLADQPETIKFRGHEWGCTRDEILESEITSDMKENVDYVNTDEYVSLLNGSVSVFDCYTYFSFNDEDQLYQGMYSLTEKHSNRNLYHDDFKKLEEAITSLYGKPLVSRDTWSDDFYHDKPDKIGTALALGDVQLFRSWEAADGSCCQLRCSGDNWEISTTLQYYPPDDMDITPEDTKTTNGL